MTKRMQPVASAARVVPKIMRRIFFDFGSRISPGRSTRDTTKGTQVAVATERVIRNTCSNVPRKSWRGRYRSQKKKNVTGTIQYASTVERTVSNAVIAERDSPCHRKCLRTSPIKYHGPSFSSVCPSGKTAGSAAMLPHKLNSRKRKRKESAKRKNGPPRDSPGMGSTFPIPHPGTPDVLS